MIPKKLHKTLRKRAGRTGVKLLDEFFSRLEPGQCCIAAASFRVAHENELELIQRLVRQGFLKHNRNIDETYHLRLLGVAVVNDVRASRLLSVCDRILVYMAERFRTDPDNKNNRVGTRTLSQGIDESEETVVEALGYFMDTPVLGSRSSNFPNSNDAYWLAGEQFLAYQGLAPLVSQLNEFVEISDGTPVTFSERSDSGGTRFDRIQYAFKNHPIAAPILALLVGLSGLSVVVAAIVYLYETGMKLFG